eukprot:Platyproteum_vivax@DN12048_c0_g1_i1.p1
MAQGGDMSALMSMFANQGAEKKTLSAADMKAIVQTLPDDLQEQWNVWTGNPAEFSKKVMPYAKLAPFSTAYLTGDPATRNASSSLPAPNTLLPLRWYRTCSKLNVQDVEVPKHLEALYLMQILKDLAKQADQNGDFKASRARFLNLAHVVAKYG